MRSNFRHPVRFAAFICSFATCTLAGPTSATSGVQRGVHSFLEIAISPDGQRVASIEGDSSPFGGEPVIRSLIVRTVDGKQTTTVPLPCGAVRECWPASPVFSPDGKTLAFALRTPGSHAYSVYAAAANGSDPHRLLKFDGTIVHLLYSRGGKLALLAIAGADKEVGATQPGAPVIGDLSGPVREQRIAMLDGETLRWASPADLFVYQFDWLPDESGFVGTAAPGNGDDNWWVAKIYRFDAATGGAKAIYTPPDYRHQIADPIVSPDGKAVAFIAGVMSDFGSTGGDVYVVPAQGGKSRDITPGMKASARSVAWDCRVGGLRAQLLAGGTSQLVSLGDASGSAVPQVLWQTDATFYRGRDAGLSQACRSPEAATVVTSYSAPPEIEVGTPGHWRALTHANEGFSLPGTVKPVVWTSDGHEIHGWLILPLHASGRLPLITSVHGGPAAAAIPNFAGPGTNTSLLERGYALFYPNFRGSFGEGEDFAQGNVRDLGRGPLKDILAGIDAVERLAPIDDARLGLTGGSYGGYMTMFAVTQTQRFKAAVAAAGISDFLSYYGENGIDEWMLPYFGTPVYFDPELYAKESPITYIRNVRTPTFSWAGALDIECPPPQTQEFWHALNELGVQTSYAVYPGEGHGLRDPDHIEDAERRTIAWFDKYLGR